MHRAEQVVRDIRAAYLVRSSDAWRGQEREFLIELVRSLDEAAFAFRMAPNSAELVQHDLARHHILLGAATALRPFIDALRDDEGGVPWAPTSSERRELADQHLINCGQLAVIQRMTALERYGLARATFPADDRLILDVISDEEDVADRDADFWLGARARSKLSTIEKRMASLKDQAAARIDQYAYVDNGWFLGYDPDEEMISYHRDFATIYSTGIAEGDALPEESILGERSFSEWNESSVTAYGRVLHHIACATRLRATNQSLDLRNLLTVFARKEDILGVWQQSGETQKWAERIMSGLTLDSEAAAASERDHEIPLPYYIDFGKHFVLLPIFGGLMNAYAGLTWHLRRTYRRDWDKAVDGREIVFRRNLREIFREQRYAVPDRSFVLRRADGSQLTDIDAVLIDKHTGRLALLQLKWLDIYGRSLAARNSRRVNLLKANDWVRRISDWVASRSSVDVGAALGINATSFLPPSILVVARHAARFSGENAYDQRAFWVSWPNLAKLATDFPDADILELLAAKEQQRPSTDARAAAGSKDPVFYRLPGLTVEVHSDRSEHPLA